MSEISKIFENNLHDYHTELARKGEEIEQLKVQLQTTELKPRESEDGIDKTAEVEKSQSYETQGVTEDALIAFNETSQVPEMHVEGAVFKSQKLQTNCILLWRAESVLSFVTGSLVLS